MYSLCSPVAFRLSFSPSGALFVFFVNFVLTWPKRRLTAYNGNSRFFKPGFRNKNDDVTYCTYGFGATETIRSMVVNSGFEVEMRSQLLISAGI